jgi:mono/diheme cytochrome c family protein
MLKSNGARPQWLAARRALGLAAAILCVVGFPLAAAAGEANGVVGEDARIVRGRDLAEAHCAVCHAIGPSDASPTRVNENTAFRRLYERYPIEMLVEAAKTGVVSGHDEMPGFDFALEDAQALLAYIDSLAPDQPGYVRKPAAH